MVDSAREYFGNIYLNSEVTEWVTPEKPSATQNLPGIAFTASGT